jgi:hypothetical protein
MKTTNHTPGPWAVETAKRFIGDSEETYDSLCVTFSSPLRAKLICELGADTLPDNPHNAHLIAAAPDLLDILRDLLDWGRVHISPAHDTAAHLLLVRAFEAVAKAEGAK